MGKNTHARTEDAAATKPTTRKNIDKKAKHEGEEIPKKASQDAFDAQEREEYEKYKSENEREIYLEERFGYDEYADHEPEFPPEETQEQKTAREKVERRADRAARKEAARLVEAAKTEDQAADFSIVRPEDWDNDDVPTRDWYWQGLFPARQVSILTAEGGVGKSLIGVQIAAASALGERELFGRRIESGPVIYLGAEDDEDEFKRRLHDIAKSFGVKRNEIKDFHLIPMAGKDAILSEPNRDGIMTPTPVWDKVESAVYDLEPAALFLDTAADLFGGDEIKRVHARQFIGMLRGLAMRLNCAVILLYHPSSSGVEGGSGKSGSTAWFNSVRSSVYMTREKGDETGNLRRLKNTKTNYGKFGDGILVKWHKGAFVNVDPNAPPAPEELKRQTDAEVEFLHRLLEHTMPAQHKRLTDSTRGNYAPKILLEQSPTSFTKTDFTGAMNRLLGNGKIEIQTMKLPNGSEAKQLAIVHSGQKYGDEK